MTLALVVVLAVTTSGTRPRGAPSPDALAAQMGDLEHRLGGRLGVHAVDTDTGTTFGWRDHETFPLCSTAKALLVGAILHRARDDPGFLERTVHWSPQAVVRASPMTTARLATGATVGELAAAAVVSSDNTASNLLNAQAGGPATTTTFVRGLGDPVTRLDRLEPMPDAVAPTDPRDTTTPAWYAHDLRELTLGAALPPTGRAELTGWMAQAATGLDQIRAGVPRGWAVGDKTGQCSQGFTNDVAVIRPPNHPPIVLTVFAAPADPHSPNARTVIADAAHVALHALIPHLPVHGALVEQRNESAGVTCSVNPGVAGQPVAARHTRRTSARP